MTRLHILRVFLGPDGAGGNPLGVVLAGGEITRERRQGLATELGFSETVFVDRVVDGVASAAIYTPGTELAFAGHPTIGAAWLISEQGQTVHALRVPAGAVATWRDGGRTWIRARGSWVHPIALDRLEDASAVDAASSAPMGAPGRYVWAWEDEAAGRLRSRYFGTDIGIPEDEATGAGAVLMGELHGRPLVIRQGVGSELLVRPGAEPGSVEVGGRVALDEVREMAVPGG